MKRPKMDILQGAPVTLSPTPGRDRVAVTKDGRILYASPGYTLGRALADGWKVEAVDPEGATKPEVQAHGRTESR